jgi:DNA polymerase elongation subunit (family B)
MTTNPQCRLLSFKLSNHTDETKKTKEFMIQMFGIDEKGKSYSIKVKGFQPFFYIKVADNWGITKKKLFIKELKKKLRIQELGKNYDDFTKGRRSFINPRLENSEDGEREDKEDYILRNREDYKCYIEKDILTAKIIKRKKLYGFDKGKEYRFVLIKFRNTSAMHKVKEFWLYRVKDRTSQFGSKDVLRTFKIFGCETELYEAKLPPLLRYFHIQEISPSGWIEIDSDQIKRENSTNCDFDYVVKYSAIKPLPHKEVGVPVKIMSYDIEAGSSHGDFPVAKKTYRKWVSDVINYWYKNKDSIKKMQRSGQEELLQKMLLTAFEFANIEEINKVYPKWKNITKTRILEKFAPFLRDNLYKIIVENKRPIKKRNEKMNKYNNADDTEEEDFNDILDYKNYIKNLTLLQYLNNDKIDKLKKLEIIDEALEWVKGVNKYNLFPLEGDPVTFIGSTFMNVGDEVPYYNHGVCLGECDDVTMENSRCDIESYEDEADLLRAWTDMVKREKPHVIIGYNIFGFDWKFMYDRSEETNCKEEFMQLSRNNGLKGIKREKSIKIASGTHNLTFIEMDGIVQVDLYNHFRKSVNLGSYKLQDVGSHFIGDNVTKCESNKLNNTTLISSKNLVGLQRNNYVCFEIVGHSNDSYMDGKKYRVIEINKDGTYMIEGLIELDKNIKLRWGLGKDDVTVADLFQAFSETGTSHDKKVIAQYCFQDCNLVHHLFRKLDIWTGMVEEANICSVPVDYIVMRGQGIKLLSFIAQKCREKRTLMPVLTKPEGDGSYEGAICLKPKRGFYDDKNPVAVVDYSSLYPSCMISENISHDSKVWTKEYDLDGKEIARTGAQDLNGNFVYDNLDDYKYVDIEYDRYEWISPDGKKKEVKVKIGTKICRFAQFPDNKKAIMPAILQNLLAARKATRVKAKYKTITLKNNKTFSGLLDENEKDYIVTDVTLSNGELKKISQNFSKDQVLDVKDTYSSFMKNIFNQRQQSIKVVANSLYGQCGAKTSSFYEMDIAASTTATGRKLLIYGQKIIENVYKNRICKTKYGEVITNAEYIYGDTDSVFFTFHLTELDGTPIDGKKGLEITIELAIEAGQLASSFLKPPHDLEYEKTFMPFLLLSKKRYVGMLYETNPNKCKEKSMGIVLKRRDNANIVKDCYGGIIKIMMESQNISKAVKFTKTFLQEMVNEKFPLEKLIISKSLRGFYKNPDSIAHRVLANRMGQRDPGNKPSVGSRIQYVYIQTKKKAKLQGDRIENPEYIIKEKLKPDYAFYITNQIQKPVTQVFALLLEQMPEFKSKTRTFNMKIRSLKKQYKSDEAKFEAQETKLRNKHVKRIIFDSSIRQANNIKSGQKTIDTFF